MSQGKQPVIYIVGPTAAGKTALSVELAEAYQGEILSGDSMQIYTDMPIATAAPTKAERARVPHHLFETLGREDSFSVSRYVDMAQSVIGQIHARSRLPFVVGGTGLYISALADNINFGAVPEDGGRCRARLEEQIRQGGLPELYDYLCRIDPKCGEKISPNDAKRIVRAVEVYTLSGETMSTRVRRSKQAGPLYRNCLIGITYRDRQRLYARIDRRVDMMLENGLLAEAKQAYHAQGGTAIQAIGHKELFPYFGGEITLEDAVEHLKMQTRRYAKRQMTWFSKMDAIHWIYMDETEHPRQLAASWIEECLKQTGGV